MSKTTPASTLPEIMAKVDKLATTRARLGALLMALKAVIEAARDEHLAGIILAATEAALVWDDVRDSIKASPECFDTPRTFISNGIKFGLQKGVGELVIADESRTIELIRQHFPRQFSALVRVEHVPVKEAIKQLQGSDMAKIGVHIAGTTDVVVLKPIDDAVDKLVKGLISDAVKQTQKAATKAAKKTSKNTEKETS